MKLKKKLALIPAVLCLAAGVSNPAPLNFEDCLPRAAVHTVGNGITVYYIKDELPQLSVAVSIGFGSLYEKKNTAGLADLLALSLSLCGSKKYPGRNMHERIESLGGRLSVGASWETTVISLRVLARFGKEALDILSDLLASPNFNAADIQTARQLLIEKIRRKSDSPEEIAFEKAREIIFDGDGYGAVPTAEKIRSYSDSLIRESWEKYFVSGNMLAGVSSGDELPAIQKELEKLSAVRKGGRARYDSDIETVRKRIRENSARIFFVRKNIPQSTIVMGTVAPDIHRPSHYPLSLMNYILGEGSFNSRLMNEIRVKKGLAYSVMSTVRSRAATGVFLAFAQTKNEQAGAVISAMRDCIAGMSSREVSDDELVLAKSSVSNSFIFRFDTVDDLLGNYLYLAYNGLPESYYRDYLAFINGVGKADIVRESRSLFNDGLIRVVVGSGSILPGLREFGEVVVIY